MSGQRDSLPDFAHAPEEYAPPPVGWVRDQLEQIDATGDTGAVDIGGRPVVVFTMRGRRSGKLRRVPLMRVEHDGAYAAVASKGGAPEHPEWYHNLIADPWVRVHDGTTQLDDMRARVAEGSEREQWWERSVAAFPQYADYQRGTQRQIPVFLVEPAQ
ncbi:MAG: nitroreductase family deazaflavin-dependent oxidoreductase [Ornithinimicrobium sp.]|uniref:nitroreductase family deazaflavin-dependent oxidoreductase n=1 Tax=Ornithinimicrobium sp. TaxID=1977084 RepID=UPI003D9BA159